MVTKHKIDMDSALDENPNENTFAYDHKYINKILNFVGRYSMEAKLNPYETMEFPEGYDDLSGKCLILDALSEPFFNEKTKNRKLGLMLIMEIHRDEMEYAMQQKGRDLIAMLKEKGIYPLTGVNRKSVL